MNSMSNISLDDSNHVIVFVVLLLIHNMIIFSFF